MSGPLHAASALVDEIAHRLAVVSPPRPSACSADVLALCARDGEDELDLLAQRGLERVVARGALGVGGRRGGGGGVAAAEERGRRAPRGARRAGCSSAPTRRAPPSAASQRRPTTSGARRTPSAARRAHVGGRVGVDPAAERLGELLHLRVDQVRIAAHVRGVNKSDSVSRHRIAERALENDRVDERLQHLLHLHPLDAERLEVDRLVVHGNAPPAAEPIHEPPARRVGARRASCSARH